MLRWITANELNELEDGMVKFIKVSGEYRFLVCTPMNMPRHSSAVLEGETAQAAGTIFMFPIDWRIDRWYSTTLKIGSGQQEKEELEAMIKRPYCTIEGGE